MSRHAARLLAPLLFVFAAASLPAQDWAEGLAAAADTSAELFARAEAAEGREAFLQKRRPSWDTTP